MNEIDARRNPARHVRMLANACLVLCAVAVITGPILSLSMLTERGRRITDATLSSLGPESRRRAFVAIAVVLFFGPPNLAFVASKLVRRHLHDPFVSPGVCRRCGYRWSRARSAACPECGLRP